MEKMPNKIINKTNKKHNSQEKVSSTTKSFMHDCLATHVTPFSVMCRNFPESVLYVKVAVCIIFVCYTENACRYS